jgi:hypothetical protein
MMLCSWQYWARASAGLGRDAAMTDDQVEFLDAGELRPAG